VNRVYDPSVAHCHLLSIWLRHPAFSQQDVGVNFVLGGIMDRDLIQKALTKWADKRDFAIADWAMEQWLTELEETGREDQELMLHMKYMLELERDPNLRTLISSIESGLPETYWAKLIPFEEQEMFLAYWRELTTVTSGHYETGNYLMWEKIHGIILKYKGLRPDLDWGPHEREALEKSKGE
jgi:hypothetical protein